MTRWGRCLLTDHGSFVVFNVYVPNSQGGPRLPFKMRWLRALRQAMQRERRKGKAVLLAGGTDGPGKWMGKAVFYMEISMGKSSMGGQTWGYNRVSECGRSTWGWRTGDEIPGITMGFQHFNIFQAGYGSLTTMVNSNHSNPLLSATAPQVGFELFENLELDGQGVYIKGKDQPIHLPFFFGFWSIPVSPDQSKDMVMLKKKESHHITLCGDLLNV